MTEQELLKAAKSGDIRAISDYIGYLIENENYSDALDWARKGAQAGSLLCIKWYITLIVTKLRDNVFLDIEELADYNKELIADCLQDMKQAEKWLLALHNADNADNQDVLSVLNDLYSHMVWCHFVTHDFQAVIERYRMITATPESQVTFWYLDVLNLKGEKEEYIKTSEILLQHHDDTLDNFKLAKLYYGVAMAYLNGDGVSPNYEKACAYIKQAAALDPDDPLIMFALHETESRNNTSSGGCYVATAVYGSYDCPQVWTLRRFRDDVLASSLAGRLFIRTYYAVSPTLVKWFGHCAWFRNLWKPTLDRMVARLNANGTEDTPYQDRSW